jgi:hypothetical protein
MNMSETFQLYPCDLKIPCDTFQCYGRAAYFLGKPSHPKNLVTKICDKCANELIQNVADAHSLPTREEKPAVEVNADPMDLHPEQFDGPVEQEEEILIDGKPLKEYSVKELKTFCKEFGIKGYSDKKEAELIQLLIENLEESAQ